MSRTGFAKDQLLSFIQRVERMEEEKKAIADDIKEIFAEARGTGFDVKIMKRVIAFRKMEKADFQEYDAMLDLYMEAVGFDHTPLGKVTTPAPKAPKAPLPAHDADTGEVIEDLPAPAIFEEELYAKAVALVMADQKASTSYIQRKLQLGYNHAAAFIERMEQAGLVSKPGHNGVREIYAPREGAATLESRVEDRQDTAAPASQPSYDVIGEIPSFLLREQPPRQPSA